MTLAKFTDWIDLQEVGGAGLALQKQSMGMEKEPTDENQEVAEYHSIMGTLKTPVEMLMKKLERINRLNPNVARNLLSQLLNEVLEKSSSISGQEKTAIQRAITALQKHTR